MSPRVEAQLTALPAMGAATLRAEWQRLTGGPVPRISPSLLRLALAWEIQARTSGGLARAAQQRLDQAGAARTRTVSSRAGMRLVREWQGKAHVVTVGDDGRVLWEGRGYASLSAVAHAITGTHWSGPAFFGLRRRKAAA